MAVAVAVESGEVGIVPYSNTSVMKTIRRAVGLARRDMVKAVSSPCPWSIHISWPILPTTHFPI